MAKNKLNVQLTRDASGELCVWERYVDLKKFTLAWAPKNNTHWAVAFFLGETKKFPGVKWTDQKPTNAKIVL